MQDKHAIAELLSKEVQRLKVLNQTTESELEARNALIHSLNQKNDKLHRLLAKIHYSIQENKDQLETKKDLTTFQLLSPSVQQEVFNMKQSVPEWDHELPSEMATFLGFPIQGSTKASLTERAKSATGTSRRMIDRFKDR